MNPNPRLRVAAAAAAARQLPECAALMTAKRKLVIPSAKPLAARPAVQIPAALAVVLVCMLTSCAGSPGHEGQVLCLWLILLGLGLTIGLLARLWPHKKPPLSAPRVLFTDVKECLAHSHWKRAQERHKARLEAARPSTLARDCETFISHSRRRS